MAPHAVPRAVYICVRVLLLPCLVEAFPCPAPAPMLLMMLLADHSVQYVQSGLASTSACMMQVRAFGEPGVLHVVIIQCGIMTVGKVLQQVYSRYRAGACTDWQAKARTQTHICS